MWSGAMLCFLAAIILYAMSAIPGGVALLLLGIVFELLGWLNLFNQHHAKNDG